MSIGYAALPWDSTWAVVVEAELHPRFGCPRTSSNLGEVALLLGADNGVTSSGQRSQTNRCCNSPRSKIRCAVRRTRRSLLGPESTRTEC